jgi:FkbM family methyltransferase
MNINNFTVVESIYGKFIVNRHCHFQIESLIKTGKPHIQAELNNLLAIAARLPPQSVSVDAGANIGLVAVPLAQAVRGRSGRVYAFEAQRMLFNALCGTTALNDLDNLFPRNQALGASSGVLHCDEPDYGTAQDFGLFSLVDQDPSKTGTIEMVSIASLDLPRLDLLKIDVEGMEVEVLKGARSVIEKYEPVGWIEYWKTGPEAIKSTFSGLHYRFYLMDQLNMLCMPVSRQKELQLEVKAIEV